MITGLIGFTTGVITGTVVTLLTNRELRKNPPESPVMRGQELLQQISPMQQALIWQRAQNRELQELVHELRGQLPEVY